MDYMSRINVAIFGSHSGHNKGDVAILDAMVNRLRQESEINKIYISSKRPKYLKQVLSETDVDLFHSPTNYLDTHIVQRLRDVDAVIIGGGGLIFDRRLLSPGYNHLVNIYVLTRLCDLLNTDYYLFSLGVNELTNKAARFMFRSVIKNSTDISVRDHFSLTETKKFTNDNISLCPDPALLLDKKSSKRIINSHDKLDSSERPTLAFFVKDSLYDQEQSLISTLSKLAESYTVCIGQTRTDQSFAHKLSASVGSNCIPLFRENNLTAQEHIALIERFDQAVCVPMHSSIFSYIAGTPYLSVAYRQKVWDFNELVGNDLVIPLDKIDKIPNHMKKLQNQQLTQKKELTKRTEDRFTSMMESLAK